MTSLAVNANNDLYLDTTGNIATVDGIYAVLQQCEHAVKAMLGEMIYAVNRGMPTMETVWLSQDLPRWEAAAYVAIQRVPGVKEVLSVVTEIQGDSLVYNAVIRTIYGEGAITNG
jgi:hypothetical protein